MIIVSARKDFNNSDRYTESGHIIRDVNLISDEIGGTVELDTLLNTVTNKKILMLVHGYNNEQDEVFDAYSVIEERVNGFLINHYDIIIGYSWPGGDFALDWWAAKKRANSVSRRFRKLMESMSEKTNRIDIMSHSLGARVVLKALKQSKKEQLIRNYFCTAPAIDNEVFEYGEEFADSIAKINRTFVFHSCRDGVLSYSYRTAEWDAALGLNGRKNPDYIQNKLDNVFVANCKKVISSHGAYKRTDKVYNYINTYISTTPAKYLTL